MNNWLGDGCLGLYEDTTHSALRFWEPFLRLVVNMGGLC
jgi:hypothetical protein